ncbi:Derlin 1 [Globomyces sp. JEL0801]|nr:Derlin 1 [Globomyces sp. JEL0801]
MVPPPAPNVFRDLKELVDRVPIITRYLVISTLAFSVGATLSLIDVRKLVLDFYPMYTKLEIWRFFTPHLLSGGQGLLFHLMFLYQQSLELESSHFGGRKADYCFNILIIMALLNVVGVYITLPVLTSAFGMALTYLYANVKGDQIVSFMFGFQFKAMYLPWVLLLMPVGVHGMGGAVPGAAAPTQTTRNAWGSGHRLGSS